MVITQTLQNIDKHVSAGHYYFHDNDESKQFIKNALCAMVYQIAERNAHYAASAAQTCQQSPNFSASTLATIWYDFFSSKFNADSGEKTYLVFDGIDEARHKDMVEFISLLHELLVSDSHIQVLLVGRPEMETITSSLDDLSAGNIDVSGTLNSHDISRFVDYSYGVYLSKHKIRGLRDTVTASLREKAHGMFLWVDLVCQELAKIKNIKVLKQHLDSMPAGLSALYERIFARMEAAGLDLKSQAQLRELFCCLSQFKEPPSVYILNEFIQYATEDPEFDVESAIADSCASLLSCEEMGRLLLQTKMKSENNQRQTQDSAETANDRGEDGDEIEEDSDLESLLDEDAAEREEYTRQRETKVNVRHASVGDFLNSKGLKTSTVLFSREDAAFHTAELSLRIICEGASAPLTISWDVWFHAMTNIFEQLDNVDEKTTAPYQTEIIIELLWVLFNSEALAKFISRLDSIGSEYVLNKSFFLGFNTDLGHKNRQAVQKWITKANGPDIIQLKPATRKWVEEIVESPLKLLVPLTKVCIHEWLYFDEGPFELYWRYRFAWLCLVATDLIPPCEPFSWQGKYPEFESSDPFNCLADIVQAERTVDVHRRIAKTMAFIGQSAMAEIEWNKAIELAETNGEEERLKELYYQFVLSLTSLREMRCSPVVLQFAEKYLALDPSNYKMQACLGLARLRHLDDRKGAIEGFRSALMLEPQDHSVLATLLDVLWEQGNFEGIMELFEKEDAEIRGGRIRACIERDFLQDVLFLAARETGKIETLVGYYEAEIARPCTELLISTDNDPRNESTWNEADEAIGRFNRQHLYPAGSALLMCRLAFLHQRYRGDSPAALRLWTTIFLERSDVYELGDISSQYSMNTLQTFMGMFAELLYEDALKPDGAVHDESLRSLERLRYRYDVFREHDEYGASLTNEKNLNLFLAMLYRQTGRNDEARELLKQQFERGIELLSDDIDWNDGFGWHILSKILFACGQKENAAIAQFLRRYVRYQPEEQEEVDRSQMANETTKSAGDKGPEKEEQPTREEDDEDGDGDRDEKPLFGIVERMVDDELLRCSMLHDCSNRGTATKKFSLFSCMICVRVQFCEDCYARHTSAVRNSTNTTADHRAEHGRLISVCSLKHEHIEVPRKGWRLKGDVMTIEGKDISLASWLESLHI
ncbi:hypothetical protein K505DRAFT_324678 [Melanomma pulvis-pyrius CBS 109.77]|uniref:Nephrocystin 3-like N-terminal domain-containing protein n=1 Tax=Melanomma pulvis-pyrius CBS 109.77 TaxID=1314802 RepID=A0A6A6XE50_9PLEO|nr:hypothetical protein K505DRAFT_324678 [Melanomma pulvis-pyrius CBS 109.77]